MSHWKWSFAAVLLAACGVKAPGFVTSHTPAITPPVSVPEGMPGGVEDGLTVVASAEPIIPDPSPPASKDADGKVHGPGGPLSAEPRECGPAQNHCLRGNGWFTDGFDKGEVASPRTSVFELEGHWYTWTGSARRASGRVFRTRPATAANLSTAKEVYVFEEAPDGKATFDSKKVYGVFPASEKEAHTVVRWNHVSPYKIDAAAGTFVDNYAKTYKIAACRVAFDMREVE